MSRALQDTHLLVSIYVMLYEFQSLGIYLHYVQSYDDTSIPSAATVVPLHRYKSQLQSVKRGERQDSFLERTNIIHSYYAYIVGAHEHSSRYLSLLLYA